MKVIALGFHGPPLEAGDPRLETFLAAVESFFGTKLEFDLRFPPEGRLPTPFNTRLVRIRDRPGLIAERVRARRPLVISAGEEGPNLSVTLQSELETRAADGEALQSVSISLVELELGDARLPSLIERCGDAWRAWHLTSMPPGVHVSLFMHPSRPLQKGRGVTTEWSALPHLRAGTFRSAALPMDLGWLNYWSERTAGVLGFPDERRDAEWLANARRTPAGAWLVQLTKEPFDPNRQDHIDALARAYRRFEAIGTRW